jgi:protein TorT
MTSILLWMSMGSAAIFAGVPEDWYPLQVDVWEPSFNTQRHRVTQSYTPLRQASKRWHFCVLIPHLKDAYWLAVNYGLADQAKRVGVGFTIFEAGGYDRLDVQRRQFEECLQHSEKRIDGIIVSAISADGLNDHITAARKQGIPVLDLINGIESPDITARSAVDFYDNGFQAGEYLRNLSPAADGEVSVAWFPGPEGAAWVAAGDAGFRSALEGSHVKIVATRKGDTGKNTQAKLIEEALDEVSDKTVDYIVGTTVTAEAAVGILRSRGLEGKSKVLAYYFGPGVDRGIRRGTILAAPTDSTVIQARIAIDTMVRILDGQPYFEHVAPRVRLIDQNNIRDWDTSTTLAPRGFRPVFSIDD